ADPFGNTGDAEPDVCEHRFFGRLRIEKQYEGLILVDRIGTLRWFAAQHGRPAGGEGKAARAGYRRSLQGGERVMQSKGAAHAGRQVAFEVKCPDTARNPASPAFFRALDFKRVTGGTRIAKGDHLFREGRGDLSNRLDRTLRGKPSNVCAAG